MKLQEKLKSAGENKLVSVQYRSWSLPSLAMQLVFDFSVYRNGKLPWDLSLGSFVCLKQSHPLYLSNFMFGFFKALFKEMHLEKL